MKNITVEQLKNLAKNLIDDGSNLEYTRAICELIADVDGVEDLSHGERAMEIAVELGCSKKIVDSMYHIERVQSPTFARENGLSSTLLKTEGDFGSDDNDLKLAIGTKDIFTGL